MKSHRLRTYLYSLGSMRVMSDSVGGALNTATYSAFGTATAQTGTTSNSHLFAGEQLDPTGLSFNRARYYDPNTRRFTQRDTFVGSASSPQSLNRFAYARNNPIGLVDPDGNAPHKWCQTEDDSGDCSSDGSGGGQSGTCADPTYAQTYPEECGTAQGGGSGDKGGAGNNKQPTPNPTPNNNPKTPQIATPDCSTPSSDCQKCSLWLYIYSISAFLGHATVVLRDDQGVYASFEGNTSGIGFSLVFWDSKETIIAIESYNRKTKPLGVMGYGLLFIDKHQRPESNLDCKAVSDRFRSDVNKITAWGLSYNADRQNSNSVARTLLEIEGYSTGDTPGSLFGRQNTLHQRGT